MFSIEQSHFLQALGLAIGNSLWQMAALWLVYAGISNVGKWSANRKYQLAAGAGIAGFIWFVITLVYACATIQVQPSINEVYGERAAGSASSFPDYVLYLYHSIYASAKSLAPYISCAYLLLFVVLSIRLKNGFKQVAFYATQGLEKSDIEWRLFVQHHAAVLGISRKVQLYVSQYVQSPLTLGFLKPIILMPLASLNHLTTAQVESILLHELAHIRRHDYLVNIFLQIAEISLFFNPFMRLLLKQVKQERENSCDDYVLQFQYCPKDYAKALLAIEHSNNTALLALAAKGNQSFQLLNRVKRMVAPQPKAFNYRQQLGLLLLFTILMLGFTVIVPHPKKLADKVAVTVAEPTTIKEQAMPSEMPAENPVVIDMPQPAFDVIKSFTNASHLSKQFINEKAFNEKLEEIELNAKEMDAMGKEVQEKMKPFTDEVTAWANRISDAAAANPDQPFNTLENLEALKSIPVAKLTEISQELQQKLMMKLNPLLKSLPFVGTAQNYYSAANDDWQNKKNNELINEANEKIIAKVHADYAKQQQAVNRNYALREVQQALKGKIPEFNLLQKQIEAKQLEALAKTNRLNLGLLTDDRDTCKAEGDGLLAKLQAHKKAFNMHFKTDAAFTVPSEIRINGKHPGKCVITVTENNVKIASENEDEPALFKLNGQNIDIHHEKQINNGKEEKVVVISISSSR